MQKRTQAEQPLFPGPLSKSSIELDSPPRVLSGIKTRFKLPPTPPSNNKRNRICHNEVCDVLRIPTSS